MEWRPGVRGEAGGVDRESWENGQMAVGFRRSMNRSGEGPKYIPVQISGELAEISRVNGMERRVLGQRGGHTTAKLWLIVACFES